jgi:hypothetical protein
MRSYTIAKTPKWVDRIQPLDLSKTNWMIGVNMCMDTGIFRMQTSFKSQKDWHWYMERQ